MFCSQCGTKLPNDSKFCHQCGTPVGNYRQSNIIRLRCEDCDGVMEIDESREVISCPYCSSKKIVLESDGVKIEKIRSASKYERKKIDRDIEQIRADRDIKVAKSNNVRDFFRVLSNNSIGDTIKSLSVLFEKIEPIIVAIIFGLLALMFFTR